MDLGSWLSLNFKLADEKVISEARLVATPMNLKPLRLASPRDILRMGVVAVAVAAGATGFPLLPLRLGAALS